jgi:hypothetical protein
MEEEPTTLPRQERDLLRGMGTGGKQHSVGKEQTGNYLI